eukprot:Seg3.22 transcript_id=Seg3.22/GoldUCD/mRNA.D3Y31 product="Ragulator complex protein LAMTOR1" protein_id=Seg3.22/GoldUCD/D3Y31
MVNGNCAVFNCTNSQYRIRKWKKEACQKHDVIRTDNITLTRATCTVLDSGPVHKPYPFPSLVRSCDHVTNFCFTQDKDQAGEREKASMQMSYHVLKLETNLKRKWVAVCAKTGSEDGTRSVSSISRTDEQSLLSRIVHKTADEIIDVSAIEPHSMERSEYMEKMRLYQERASGSNVRPPKHKVNLPNTNAPMNMLLGDPINVSDIKLITDSSISASNAVNKMEINAKEPLVVPFGVNEAVTA